MTTPITTWWSAAHGAGRYRQGHERSPPGAVGDPQPVRRRGPRCDPGAGGASAARRDVVKLIIAVVVLAAGVHDNLVGAALLTPLIHEPDRKPHTALSYQRAETSRSHRA